MQYRKTIKRLTYIIIAALLCVLTVICGQFKLSAFADTTDGIRAAYENTNVWDNLQGSTIGGNAFNIEDYPHNENGKPQMISFVEFCYSCYSDKQDNFGLYIYVYNPQDIAFDTKTERNKIQFRCGNLQSAKYTLDFLNYSNKAGYEGRFYKFRIRLSLNERNRILKALNENSRVYEITEIELVVKGNVTAYSCDAKYTYSGYVKGYGSELAESDTLSCMVDGFDKSIELDVKHTVYRPQGDYFEGKQSQLNSCYFRIPEKYFTDYGELSKIACEWYEYITKPMLVTQTDYLYQQLYNLHGDSVKNFDARMAFLLISLSNTDTSWFGKETHGLGWTANIEMKDKYSWIFQGSVEDAIDPEIRFDNFAAVFYSGSNKSYKDRYVTSEELQSQLLANSEILGAPYLTERYSEKLFTEYVNRDHKRGLNKKEIKKDDLFDVFWTETVKGMWQNIFGGYDVNTIYDSVKAILTLNDTDLSGSDEEISKRLYVSQGDIKSIKAEYSKAVSRNERLVLFRFGESDYYSIPCVEAYCSSSTDKADDKLAKDCYDDWHDGNYTAYISQETVYLDFDIISLWFTADGVETEIPVVHTPTDVISGLTPPLDENYHNNKEKSILAVIFAIVAVFILVGLIYVVVKSLFPQKTVIQLVEKKKKE